MPVNGRCMCNGEGWDGCEVEMTVVHDAALRRAIEADSSPITLADSMWAESLGISMGASEQALGAGPVIAGALPSGVVSLRDLIVGSYDSMTMPQWALGDGHV